MFLFLQPRKPPYFIIIFVSSQRSSGELASYQKKLIRIDDHMGIAIAGLTSDARVLSNYMRTEAMRSKMLYDRPLPVYRIVSAIGDKAQVNTQVYGRRPYGVGLLVSGYDVRSLSPSSLKFRIFFFYPCFYLISFALSSAGGVGLP